MEISPYLLIPLLTLIIRQLLNMLGASSLKNLSVRKLFDFSTQPHWLVIIAWSLVPVTYFVDGAASPWLATNLLLSVVILQQQKAVSTYLQQLSGVIMGIASGTILSFSYWRDDLDWLLSRPDEAESRSYLIVFGALFILAELLTIRMRRSQMRKLPTSRRLQRTFRLTLTLPAIFGLIVAFLQNQTRNAFLTDRIFTYILFAWVVSATVWASYSVYRTAKARLEEESAHFNQQKKKAKKKKKRKTKR